MKTKTNTRFIRNIVSTAILLMTMCFSASAQYATISASKAIYYKIGFKSNTVPAVYHANILGAWTLCPEPLQKDANGMYAFNAATPYVSLKIVADITSLGVSNNYEINNVNVTNCPNLAKLYVSRTDVDNLFLSSNKNLEILTCNYTKIKSLYLYENPKIKSVECAYSQISNLYVSQAANPLLTHFVCEGNAMKINTLPRLNIPEYWYAYQTPTAIPSSISLGQYIDLQENYYVTPVNGIDQATKYTWYNAANNSILTEGVDYRVTNNTRFYFLKPYSSVYCKMTHPAFPNYTNPCNNCTGNCFTCGTNIGEWRTNTASIIDDSKTKPYITLTCKPATTPDKLAAYTATGIASIYYDGGKSYIGDDFTLPVAGGTIYIYGNVTTLYSTSVANQKPITSINFNNLTSLSILKLPNQSITTLDLSKQTNLYDCDFENNQLLNLDLSQNPNLVFINVAGNGMKTLALPASNKVSDVNCSNNAISNLNLTNVASLYSLNCSYNNLTSLTTATNTLLYSLNCSHNGLSELNLLANQKLTLINCSYNNLNFNTLKVKKSNIGQTFNPQNPINIPTGNNGMVDLKQYGAKQYTWIAYGFRPLVKDKTEFADGDYREIDGVFYFHKSFGPIFCRMTNTDHSWMELVTTPTSNTSTLKSSQETDLTTVAENEVATATVAVLPNPAQNSISVSGLDGASLQIVAFTGTVVKDIAVYDGGSIDISSLEAGLYTVVSGGTEVRFVKE